MNTKSIKTSVIILLIGALLSGGFFGYNLSEVDRGEELIKLATYLPTTPTKLYDLNGVPFAELYRHRQELLRFQDIPPHVIHAFISVEDNNFYNHFGIDFKAIIRAGFINLIHLKVKQGGSTITQQLSKAILKNSKKSFTRKFIEALLTLQIEQEYSKEEILSRSRLNGIINCLYCLFFERRARLRCGRSGNACKTSQSSCSILSI